MCVYTCACVGAGVHVGCAHVCECVETRGQLQLSFLSPIFLFACFLFETGSLSDLESAKQATLAGQPTSVSTSPALGSQVFTSALVYFM